MTNRSPKRGQSKSSAFALSLILGLLLIPLSAVAAAALISSDAAPESASVEAVVVDTVPETTVTTTKPEVVETVFVTEAPTATAADLETACGSDGIDLVEREAAGTITALEQAALDALRQICADEGLELPGPPAPPAVVRTVTVVDPAPSPSTTSATVTADQSTSIGDDSSSDDHGDDESKDDEHDDEDEGHGDDD